MISFVDLDGSSVTRFAVAAALLAAISVSGSAASAPSGTGQWLPPTVGLDPAGGSLPGIAVAPGGVAVAAWSRSDGSGKSAKVSTRGASHRWGPIATPTTQDLYYQRLAMSGREQVLLTGVQVEGLSIARVVAYERPPNSVVWKGPIPLDAPTSDPWGPDVAINDAGLAVVAWKNADRPGDLPVIRATLRHADGKWEAPQNLGYGGPNPPSVAIDDRGNAVVVWTRSGSADASVYSELRPAGGTWGSAILLSDHAWDGSARVHMNARGDALAVWGARDESGHFRVVSSLRRADGSAWATALPISISDPETALSSYYGLSFVLDDKATATLAAPRSDGTVEAATSVDGTGWVGPTRLGDAGTDDRALTDVWCVHPEAAQSGTGDTVVLWGGADLHSTRRRPGGTAWEDATIVSHGPSCFALAVAADAKGNAVALW